MVGRALVANPIGDAESVATRDRWTDAPLSVCRHHSDLDRNVTTGGYVADLASGSVRLWASRTCSNLVTEARLERPPSPTAPVAILGLPYIVLLFG